MDASMVDERAALLPRLRLWPGVVAATLCLIRFILPSISAGAILIAVGCGAAGVLGVVVWWLFFSRASRTDRWSAIALFAAAAVAVRLVVHPSIATGMMSLMPVLYVVPTFAVALVIWAVATQRMSAVPRHAMLWLTVCLTCGGWATLRTDGVTGQGQSQFAWRWTPTTEQRLLSREDPVATAASAPPESVAAAPVTLPEVTAERVPTAPTPSVAAPAGETVRPFLHVDWPGFRGVARDSHVSGLRIRTDWATSPPAEIWRRPVGPGWSSFAVGDGRVYTQEQRGDFEVIAAYDLGNGRPVWSHRTNARFWESNAGAGPRGTPTLHEGRVYALGATGILTAADAATGRLLWTRNTLTDTGAKLPEWGISGSPLIVGSDVLVAAAGRLASYQHETGKPRWYATESGASYSSPQLLTIGGERQIVLLTHAGVVSVAPADGRLLWKHEWPGFAMLQPGLADADSLLITTATSGGGAGTKRIHIARGPEGWKTEEMWTSTGLKPYFNDVVVHQGYVYGFDGGILSCIDLQDGSRKWKGGRYGHGQLILLVEQSMLLVLSEEGELALVAASPNQFTEIARVPALQGKTWNHPAIAGDVVLVRNGEEMAAFRLARTVD